MSPPLPKQLAATSPLTVSLQNTCQSHATALSSLALFFCRVTARIGAGTAQDAVLIAGRILNALDYVGVIGVELFVTVGGGLVVNEIAPRVHNSGHWTQDGCLIDQFEQHVRAILGWPLGDGARHSDAVMTNLLGDEVLAAPSLTGAALHLYGKAEARPGRKMGHVTYVLRP